MKKHFFFDIMNFTVAKDFFLEVRNLYLEESFLKKD